jgi:hypothetical protein
LIITGFLTKFIEDLIDGQITSTPPRLLRGQHPDETVEEYT